MDPIENITDQALVSLWAKLLDEVAGKRTALYAIEGELRLRMLRNGATEISHPNYSVKLRPGPPSYDPPRLLPLLEREDIMPEALAKAYYPEYQEMKSYPARWDGNGLKELRKLGGEIAQIIDDATFRGDPKLEIRPLKAKE